MSGMFGPGTPAPIPGAPPSVYDAYGLPVPSTQLQYVKEIMWINGSPKYIYGINPYYTPPAANTGSSGGGAGPSSGTNTIKFTSSPQSLQYHFTFDTIGQSIYRSIGSCCTPLRMLWVQGVTSSEQVVTDETVNFAAAMSSPIDKDELGDIGAFYLGRDVVYDADLGVILPIQMDPAIGSLLTFSLQNALVYSGDEGQEPCDLILADRGADVCNSFRGLRYILFPSYPLRAGMDLGIVWRRTNPIS